MITGFQQDALGDYIVKAPTAELDYTLDWSAWLGTDTISVSVWSIPIGLTVGAASNTPTTTTQWMGASTLGTTYNVTNYITSAGGRKDSRSFRVICRNK
ncbi:MAG: hypothetical protein ABIT70_08220 [Sulfuriferula sp.]